jgi:hypothetical protein
MHPKPSYFIWPYLTIIFTRALSPPNLGITPLVRSTVSDGVARTLSPRRAHTLASVE